MHSALSSVVRRNNSGMHSECFSGLAGTLPCYLPYLHELATGRLGRPIEGRAGTSLQ